MKQILKVSLLAAAMAVVITGCQKDEKAAASADAAKVELKSFEDTSAYAIGQSMGRYISNTLERQQELGVKLDNAMIMQGVQDGLVKKSLLNEEQLEKALKDYDQKINQAAAKKAVAKKAAAKPAAKPAAIIFFIKIPPEIGGIIMYK